MLNVITWLANFITCDKMSLVNTGAGVVGGSRANTSGVRVVGWHRALGKWQARIMFSGVMYCLGCYGNFEDAVTARKHGEERYYREYLESIGELKNGNDDDQESYSDPRAKTGKYRD